MDAMPAGGGKHHNDMISCLEVGNAGSGFANDACRFVADDGGNRPRTHAGYGRKIGVTQACCDNLHQNLTRSRRVEFYFFYN